MLPLYLMLQLATWFCRSRENWKEEHGTWMVGRHLLLFFGRCQSHQRRMGGKSDRSLIQSTILFHQSRATSLSRSDASVAPSVRKIVPSHQNGARCSTPRSSIICGWYKSDTAKRRAWKKRKNTIETKHSNFSKLVYLLAVARLLARARTGCPHIRLP